MHSRRYITVIHPIAYTQNRWSTMKNPLLFMGIAALSFITGPAFSQAITVVNPTGSRIYNADDSIVITWQADSAISRFNVEYTLTGTGWAPVETYTSARKCVWFAPFFKTACNTVRIRVTAANITDPPSALSDEFSINASPAVDPNEPNDSLSAARNIVIGSLVSGCVVYGVQDTLADPPKQLQDTDWFRFTLSSATLLTINLIPEFPGLAGVFSRVNSRPYFALCDTAQNVLAGSNSNTLTCRTAGGGNYYCRVETAGSYGFYGIRIDTASGSGGITITAPNGGESFEGDAPVTISWTGDPSIGGFEVEYSLSNGSTWVPVATSSSTGCVWYTPYLAIASTTALVRVSAADAAHGAIFDVSDSTFTIRQAPFADPYEPNNTADAAHEVTLDSLYSGAVAYGGYADTSSDSVSLKFIEEDYYKFTLPAAGLITIRTLPEYGTEPLTFNRSDTPPNFVLSDSANRWITMTSRRSISYNAPYAGKYHLRVYSGAKSWCKYGILVLRGGSTSALTLTEPSGFGRYGADEPVMLAWTADNSLASFTIQYRFLDREYWSSIATVTGRTYTWYAPFLKSDARVQMRVVAANVAGSLADSTDSALVITASATIDPFEPNDDTATARLVHTDTVLSGCIVYGFPDTIPDPEGIYTDRDIFRLDLDAGTLVTIKTLPEFIESGNGYNRSNTVPGLTLTDASGGRLAGSVGGSINFYSTSDRSCFCTVTASDLWHKYKMSVSSVVPLARETSTFTGSAVRKLPDSTYSVRISADTTDVVIDVNLKHPVDGTVSTAIVDPKSLPPVNTSEGNFKTISVAVDSAIHNSFNSADITLQYDPAVFTAPVTEKAITAMWFNDSIGEWRPVEFILDTAGNIVTIRTTHLSLFGLFAPQQVAAGFSPASAPRQFAIRAAVINGRPAVHLYGISVSAQPCIVRLYTVTGKLAGERIISAIDSDGRYRITFDCANLAGGSYIVSATQGANHARALMGVVK